MEKHKQEFNNFVERIGYPDSLELHNVDDGLTRYSRALLDRFLAPGKDSDHLVQTTLSSTKGTSTSSSPSRSRKSDAELEVEKDWAEYEKLVCEWASHRGQTLARTVRGVSCIRDALLFIGKIELKSASEKDLERLVNEKFQLLVAAQIFGSRKEIRHRRDMRALMSKFPHIEVVYDFNHELDLRARSELKCNFIKRCIQISSGGDTPSLSPSAVRTTLEAASSLIDEPLDLSVCCDEHQGTEAEEGLEEKGESVVESSGGMAVPTTEHLWAAIRQDVIEHMHRNVRVITRLLIASISSTGVGGDNWTGTPEQRALSETVWLDVLQVLHDDLQSVGQLDQPSLVELQPTEVQLMMKNIQKMVQIHQCLDKYHLEFTVFQALKLRMTVARQRSDSFLQQLADYENDISEALQSLSLHLGASPTCAKFISIPAGLFTRKMTILDELSRTLVQNCEAHSDLCALHMKEMDQVLEQLEFLAMDTFCGEGGINLIEFRELNKRIRQLDQLVQTKIVCDHLHRRAVVFLEALSAVKDLNLSKSQWQQLQSWVLTDFSFHLKLAPPCICRSTQELESFIKEAGSQKMVRRESVDRKIKEAERDLSHWLPLDSLKVTSSTNTSTPTLLHISHQYETIGSLLPPAVQLIESILTQRYAHTVQKLKASSSTSSTASSSSMHLDLSTEGNTSVSVSLNLNIGISGEHEDRKAVPGGSIKVRLLREIMEMTKETNEMLVDFRMACIEGSTAAGPAGGATATDASADNQARVSPVRVSAELLLDAVEKLRIYKYSTIHIKRARRLRPPASSQAWSRSMECRLNSIRRMYPLILGQLQGFRRGETPQTNAKSENQLHAMVVARGEVIQTIDMNQDFFFEEALKMRLFLEEFQFSSDGFPRYNLVGCPEIIYTDHMSAAGRFMALQDMSFVSIVQRVLNYTSVRMHYGHPDIFDGFWCRFHVGLSKASAEINLSEDLFFGLDNISRGGHSTFVEYIRFGKGREVGLNNCAIFEDKISRGAAMALKSPDFYRLSRWLDCVTNLSLMFGSIGHYLYTLLFDYAITSFLWVMLLMGITQVTSEKIGILGSVYAIPWIFHLGFAFGLPLLFQLVHDKGLFSGTKKWIQNLLLGSVFYLFQLRTKAVAVQQAFQGGSAQYQGTGRSLALDQNTLLQLYRLFACSHYHHALQLLTLLGCYVLFLANEPLYTILLKSYAILIACWSWIFAPPLFNPAFFSPTQLIPLIAEKRREALQLFQWVTASYDEHHLCDSWQRWWWERRFASLRLKAVRYRMQKARSRGMGACCSNWSSHPLLAGLWSLVCRALEWLPWSLLLYGLYSTCHDILLHIVSYLLLVGPYAKTLTLSSPRKLNISFAYTKSIASRAFAVRCLFFFFVTESITIPATLPRIYSGFVHCVSPSKLQTLMLGTVVLVYYSYMQIDNIINQPFSTYSVASYKLPLSRMPSILAAVAIFELTAFIMTDLLLHIVDIYVMCKLGRLMAASSKGTSGGARDSQETKELAILRQRPWIIRIVCQSRLFFPWQLCMR